MVDDSFRRQKELLEQVTNIEDHDERKRLLTEVVAIGAESAYGLYSQGVLAGYDNNTDRMIQKISVALRLQPDFPLAHNDLGVAHLAKGDMEEALREVDEALRQLPHTPLFHNNRGAILYQQNRISESQQAYEKAVELMPGFVLPHYNLGMLFFSKLGLNDAAEREFRESVRLAPQFAMAHAFLGTVLLEKNILDAAEKSFQEAMKLEPQLWLAHLGLGGLYQTIGQTVEDKILYEDALEHLNEGIKRATAEVRQFGKTAGPVYGLRGYINAQLGRYKEAHRDFVAAVELDPNDWKSRRNLRRLREASKTSRAPFVISICSWILGGAGFLAFLLSFFLLYRKSLQDRHFVFMSLGFFILTVLCLYLPHITRLKLGSVELEKITAKSIDARPQFEK